MSAGTGWLSRLDEDGVPTLGTIAKAAPESLMYVLRRQIEGMDPIEIGYALTNLKQLTRSLERMQDGLC